MSDKKFSTADRIKSFSYALQGLKTFFSTQHNAWIHFVISLLVIAAGFYFRIYQNDWLWIVFAITIVFITEMVNTAIEFLSDFVSPEIHPMIKKVKDVSAAAVLIASIGSVIIGLVVFVPKIYIYF
jgi:diacylglycerol kinase